MAIGVLLVDDHRMFRDGIRNLLDQQVDIQVLGEAADGRTAVRLAQQLAPQVVVLDLTMPHLNGIDAASRIHTENAAIKLIALSMHAERHLVHEMLEAGVSGYLLKECAFEELVQAIHVVHERNQVYLSPEIACQVVDEYLHPAYDGTTATFSCLTSKERIILQLIAEGSSNPDIAEALHLSPRTVEKHRYRLMDKLEVHDLAGLIRYAIREGITKP